MVLIQIILDTVWWLLEHWEEATAIGVINFVAIAAAKRMTAKKLMGLFGLERNRDLHEVNAKLDLLLKERGLTWAGHGKESKNAEVTNSKKLFFSLRTAMSRVNRRRMKKMKEKFKSRKFWVAIVSAGILIAKEGFGIEVDSETILAFTGIVLTWILGEAHVDAKRAQKGAAGVDYTKADQTGE